MHPIILLNSKILLKKKEYCDKIVKHSRQVFVLVKGSLKVRAADPDPGIFVGSETLFSTILIAVKHWERKKWREDFEKLVPDPIFNRESDPDLQPGCKSFFNAAIQWRMETNGLNIHLLSAFTVGHIISKVVKIVLYIVEKQFLIRTVPY